MTEDVAMRTIKGNNMFYACTMLKCGDVDGVVGGAVFSSADVSRAAFQVIKAAPGIKSVSSCFVMIPPKGSSIPMRPRSYSRTAPSFRTRRWKQLSDIVQAAYFSAKQIVEVEPKIAMLSFSTKGSASTIPSKRSVRRTPSSRRRTPTSTWTARCSSTPR